jgi:hypothetical protein
MNVLQLISIFDATAKTFYLYYPEIESMELLRRKLNRMIIYLNAIFIPKIVFKVNMVLLS